MSGQAVGRKEHNGLWCRWSLDARKTGRKCTGIDFSFCDTSLAESSEKMYIRRRMDFGLLKQREARGSEIDSPKWKGE